MAEVTINDLYGLYDYLEGPDQFDTSRNGILNMADEILEGSGDPEVKLHALCDLITQSQHDDESRVSSRANSKTLPQYAKLAVAVGGVILAGKVKKRIRYI